MPIAVTCPNGHALKIKDKYAGKSGYCPRCRAPIDVPAIDPLADEDLVDLKPRKHVAERPQPIPRAAAFVSTALAGDDDEPQRNGSASASAESLLSSAIIRHKKTCPGCKTNVLLWCATCPHCGLRLD